MIVQQFARTEGQNVLEWPVFEQHIRNRGLPLTLFTKVEPTLPPIVDTSIQEVRRIEPAFVDGVLQERWETVFKPTADIETTFKQKINRVVDGAIESLKTGYPLQEVETWTLQKLEADAWTVDSTAATPTLSGIAVRRGVTLDVVVGKVRAKSDQYQTTLGLILGNRQAAEDKLTALLELAERPDDFAKQLRAIMDNLTSDWPASLTEL